jgi:hypothetical protein
MKMDHTKISNSRVSRGFVLALVVADAAEPNSDVDDDDCDASSPRPPIPKDENSK